MTEKLHIDVWSDVACPWCWVGKKRLEAALAQFEHGANVAVTFHSFELDPSAPREHQQSHVELLSRKYGASAEDARAMIERMTQVGRRDGITFDFDRARSGNTFDAHRLIHFAKTKGMQTAMKERLFRAYFSEGQSLGDRAELVRLAKDVGLDESAARAMLESDAHESDVREDEAAAREIGIRGVPFFVLGGRYAVSGAQPADVLLRAIRTAYAEAAPAAAADDGAACGPGNC